MDKVLEYLKEHVKVTVTVVVLGLALTVGWAKGCVAQVGSAPVAVEVAE
jgi:predicted negative regulator of RcsB-dependent stress response